MIEVENGNIKEFGYVEDKKQLLIVFRNGNRYIYLDVPNEVYEGLIDAPSKGSYLHRNIKGYFRFISISENDTFTCEITNLCDTCIFEFATCKSNPLFGCGEGNDNVYSCDGFENGS